MSRELGTESRDVEAAKLVALRWADYTKTAGMYPATSQRVEACLTALFDVLQTFSRNDDIAVRMNGDEVIVGRTRFPLEDIKLLWLHERLHKGALDGIVFGPGARETLPAFTARLLANFARKRKEVDPDALWPEMYTGLQLLHRRFEGGFLGGGGSGHGPFLGPTDTGTASDGGTGGGGSESDALAARLANETQLKSAVSRIRSRLVDTGLFEDTDSIDETDFRIDLLGKVAQALPTSTNSYEEIVGSSVGLLTCLDDHLSGQVALGNAPESTASEELQGLVFLASRMFFRPRMQAAVRKAPEEEEEKPRARGRAGDEKVTADLDALLEEVRAMPELEVGLMTVDPDEFAREQLDVYLHFLMNRTIDQPAENLVATLRGLLHVEDRRQATYVKACLTRAWEGSNAHQRQRILEFADSEHMPRLLREFGILTPASVLAAFPDQFVMYVDALDMTRTDDREELRDLLKTIGSKRLLMGGPTLVDQHGLLERDRARRLLTFNADEVLALAPAMLTRENAEVRSLVLSRIRRSQIRIPEARMLSVTSDAAHVTSAFLSALIRASILGNLPVSMSDHAVAALSDVIDQAGKAEGLTSLRRLDAVRALGAMQTPRARTLLLAMLRRRFFFLFRTEPRPVRETVREALNGTFRTRDR